MARPPPPPGIGPPGPPPFCPQMTMPGMPPMPPPWDPYYAHWYSQWYYSCYGAQQAQTSSGSNLVSKSSVSVDQPPPPGNDEAPPAKKIAIDLAAPPPPPPDLPEELKIKPEWQAAKKGAVLYKTPRPPTPEPPKPIIPITTIAQTKPSPEEAKASTSVCAKEPSKMQWFYDGQSWVYSSEQPPMKQSSERKEVV